MIGVSGNKIKGRRLMVKLATISRAVCMAGILLTGCAADESPPVVPIGDLQTHAGFWLCHEFRKNPAHIIESCYVEFEVDTSQLAGWERIGCFGEFKFTQVSEGKVSERQMPFFISSDNHDWPNSFKVYAFVYFPAAYEALDPALNWYQCQALSPGDDKSLPPKLLQPVSP